MGPSLNDDLGVDTHTASSDRAPLKICLAAWAPFVGGAEIGAERTALGLQQAGHEVVMILGHRGAVMDRMQQAGLRCIHSPMYFTDKLHWWRYFRARHGLRSILRQERPHLVHSNDLPTHQIVSDAARGLCIPRITHHKFPFGEKATEWLTKFGAEHHIFVSQALMEEMCSQSERLRRTGRSVIYDGLPMPAHPRLEDRRRARQELNLDQDKIIVTFVGQIIERKGVAELLEAWSLLPAEVRKRAELYLLGESPRGEESYRIAVENRSHQLGGGVHFVGFQASVDLWLKATDIMTLPSHVDPLPLAIMEAMCYALPVLACSVTGIPELVLHEVTGLLVPPRQPAQLAAALHRLVADEVLRIRYGKEGRRRCESLFDLDTHVRNLEAAYRRVLQQCHLQA